MKLRIPILNLLLMAVSVAVSLVALEFAARWMLADISTSGDRNAYLSQRWYADHPARQNALGFRERDFLAEADAGVTRIALVGDSFTWGPGLLEDERISNRLQSILNEQGDGVFEVLNFGQPGANFEEHLRNLKIALASSKPDYVLLQLYLNDFDDPSDQRPKPKQLGSIFHHPLTAHSVLYSLANSVFVDAQMAAGLVKVDEYYARFLDPAEPIAARANERFLRVVKLAREANRPIGAFVWPDLTRPLGTSPNDALIDKILETCLSEGVDCIDLRIALRVEPRHDRLIVNRFDTHASAQANAMAAELIMAHFGGEWHALSKANRLVKAK